MSRVARPFVSKPRHPITGKRLRVTGKTRRELDARLHRLQALREDQRLGILTPDEVATSLRGLEKKRVTLKHAAHSYAALTRLSKNTRSQALSMVSTKGILRYGRPTRGPLAELGPLLLEELTPPRLAKHFRKLADRVAWATVDTAWSCLGAIIRHAAEEGWIVQRPWGLWRPAEPTVKKRRPRRECCRNAGERTALLHAARELLDESMPAGRRLELLAVLAVALYTGVRKGELAGFKWKDVLELEGGAVRILVVRQYRGRPLKEGDRRVVDVLPDATDVLDALAPLRPGARPSAPIFPNASGEHYSQGDVIDVEHLRAAAARAGLGDPQRWSLHSLRDSFVTIEAQACGGDLRRLAERTGHRSIDSLLRYLQTFEREPRAVPAAPSPRLLPSAV